MSARFESYEKVTKAGVVVAIWWPPCHLPSVEEIRKAVQEEFPAEDPQYVWLSYKGSGARTQHGLRTNNSF